MTYQQIVAFNNNEAEIWAYESGAYYEQDLDVAEWIADYAEQNLPATIAWCRGRDLRPTLDAMLPCPTTLGTRSV